MEGFKMKRLFSILKKNLNYQGVSTSILLSELHSIITGSTCVINCVNIGIIVAIITYCCAQIDPNNPHVSGSGCTKVIWMSKEMRVSNNKLKCGRIPEMIDSNENEI